MKAIAVGLLMAVFAHASPLVADQGDMRIGSFIGVWCNYSARFDVKTKNDRWEFWGNVYIHTTGQYDRFYIKQYADNHLRMIRYLSGSYSGQRQIVETHPPETYVRAGQHLDLYQGRATSGPGCGDNARTYLHVPIE